MFTEILFQTICGLWSAGLIYRLLLCLARWCGSALAAWSCVLNSTAEILILTVMSDADHDILHRRTGPILLLLQASLGNQPAPRVRITRTQKKLTKPAAASSTISMKQNTTANCTVEVIFQTPDCQDAPAVHTACVLGSQRGRRERAGPSLYKKGQLQHISFSLSAALSICR